MSEQAPFSAHLRLLQGYKFEIDFGESGKIYSDEPLPLGTNQGPNPELLLAAAVANCLAASLIFAVRKYKEDPGLISAIVNGVLKRQEGRLRIERLEVALKLGNNATALHHFESVLKQFEQFCVVTQSVREGIEIAVKVSDRDGKLLLNHS